MDSQVKEINDENTPVRQVPTDDESRVKNLLKTHIGQYVLSEKAIVEKKLQHDQIECQLKRERYREELQGVEQFLKTPTDDGDGTNRQRWLELETTLKKKIQFCKNVVI